MESSHQSDDVTDYLSSIANKQCEKSLMGIAIGVLIDGQEFTACAGLADGESRTPISEATVFEVGSLTKLFTSLLLAVAVKNQEVQLDEPVQAAMGTDVNLPTDGESEITYRSLANHRSSLPRLPDNLLADADLENPYVHYDQDMLYACLNEMESVKRIGSRSLYSNFGVGLLGHVLGRVANSNYAQALKSRVLEPLGMRSTFLSAPHDPSIRTATAHTKKDKPTKHWNFNDVTVAAGGLRSSLSDMLKFLRANVSPESSSLADAVRSMQEPSERPEHTSRFLPWFSLFYPVAYVLSLVAFVVFLFGFDWLTDPGPDSLRCFSFILLPTQVAAIAWGRNPARIVLAVMTLLSIWLWSIAIAHFCFVIWGLCLIYSFSDWKMDGSAMATMLRGDGHLAWQSAQVGGHPILWHNGMVGGAASYLAIVPQRKIGVVVLTNTAVTVDLLGDKILKEVLGRKEAAIL